MVLIEDLFKITYFDKSIKSTALENRKFLLDESTSTRWEYKGKDFRILVKQGFEWDGATIPRILWTILGVYPAGILLVASLFHDEIYKKKGWVMNYGKEVGMVFINRQHCDQLFYMHMLKSGVEKKKAKRLYRWVRRLGRYYWLDVSKGWTKRIFA
jgi:hypothetical protein